MNRKLFSVVGAFVAIYALTVGCPDVEARNCGWQRNRCCQQSGNFGCQQNCNGGYRQGRLFGNGFYNGNGWGQTGNCGCQPMYNNVSQQAGNNCCQQVSYSSCQQSGNCAPTTTACCSSQYGVIQTGMTNGQPSLVPPAVTGNPAPPPATSPAPPIEPAKSPAPAPGK